MKQRIALDTLQRFYLSLCKARGKTDYDGKGFDMVPEILEPFRGPRATVGHKDKVISGVLVVSLIHKVYKITANSVILCRICFFIV